MTRLTAGIVVLSFLVLVAVEARRSSKKAAEGIQRAMFDQPMMHPGGTWGMNLSDAPAQQTYYAHSSEDQELPAIVPCQEVKCHMTLVVALDASASVERANFYKEVAFAQKLLEIMALKAAENDVKICVGVLTYSTLVNVIVDPCCENSLCRITEKLQGIPYDKKATNTLGVLKVGRQMLQSAASYHKVLLLITDGKSTSTYGSPIPFAQQMRNEDGVEIVTLGVGYSIRESELREISGSTEDVLLIKTFNDFHELASLIISANSMGSSLEITFEEFCEEDFSTFSETCDRDCIWEEWSDCEPDGTGSHCTTMQPCVLPDGNYVKSRVKECICPTDTGLRHGHRRKSRPDRIRQRQRQRQRAQAKGTGRISVQ